MPGWLTHIEAAKQAVNRLRNGDTPADFPKGVDAKQLAKIAYTWRNYLALGAIGPDIFYLLPDFRPSKLFHNLPNDLMTAVNWLLSVWKKVDDLFIKSWDDYAAPAIRGEGAILNQMSGGLIREIGEALQENSKIKLDLLLDMAASLWDWFGIFGSGVPDGLSESEFFWSDMFHYRSTYKFAHRLFLNAKSDQEKAFALGWITHCATDVTGHPFVNEKVGGPWRLHWQRHHLVENHIDAKIYDTQHNGIEPYGELDTSCLHFYIAFRKRNDGDYATPDRRGFDDAPAYDYFQGFPAYDGHNPLSGLDTSDTDAGDNNRAKFFDMDTAPLSDRLCDLLIQTMKDVYYAPNQTSRGPQILMCTDRKFHDDDSGRPSALALKNTYSVLYEYIKMGSTAGYSPPVPTPPPVFNDHSPPPFPQPSEDMKRGADPQSDIDKIVEGLFAAFAVVMWVFEFAGWLVTLPEAVVADLLTYAPRELLYLIAVQPLYTLYLATRQPLVMCGFLHPKHSEISQGLVQLGVSTSEPFRDLAKALESVGLDPWPPPQPPTSEPSGRASASEPAFEVDIGYPRAIIRDDPTAIAQLVGYVASWLNAPDIPFCFQKTQPSEFLRPWRYPEANNAQEKNGSEPLLTHPGPWIQGQTADVLMNTSPGDPQARLDFESAKSPDDCECFCEAHFPNGSHLGDPVDYSVYLIGRLANMAPGASIPPDFNLDSDRGYGYHCWDWDRDPNIIDKPQSCPAFSPEPSFDFRQPLTVPEGFCKPGAETDVGPHYEGLPLKLHFVDQQGGPPSCRPPEKK